MIDRTYFNGASFKGAKFSNAVLSSTSFDGADLTDTDFTEAYVGQYDQKKLCNRHVDRHQPVDRRRHARERRLQAALSMRSVTSERKQLAWTLSLFPFSVAALPFACSST